MADRYSLTRQAVLRMRDISRRVGGGKTSGRPVPTRRRTHSSSSGGGNSILVAVSGIAAKNSGTGTKKIWEDSNWVDDGEVTVHNRSNTAIGYEEVEMIAVKVSGEYVLSWQDLSGLPGFAKGTDPVADAQGPYHAGDSQDFLLGHGDCEQPEPE